MEEITLGSISKRHREVIGSKSDRYRNIEVDNILINYYAVSKNKLKEKIWIVIRNSGVREIDKFYWHLPYITDQMKVCSISCKMNPKILSFIDTALEDHHLIEFHFTPLNQGETIFLEFEYFISYYESAIRKGLFYDTFECNIAFESLGIIKSFQIAIHLDKNATYKYDSNLDKFREFEINNEKILMVNESNVINGQLFAKIFLKKPTSIYIPILSLLISIIFSMCIALLQIWYTKLGDLTYLLFTFLFALNLVLVKLLFRK